MMTSPDKINIESKSKSVMRPVEMTELDNLKAYEVMENDLLAFESATDEEKYTFSMLTFFLGIAIPLVIGWFSSETGTIKTGAYAGAMFSFLGLSIISFVLFLTKRKQRNSLLGRLKRLPSSLPNVKDATPQAP